MKKTWTCADLRSINWDCGKVHRTRREAVRCRVIPATVKVILGAKPWAHPLRAGGRAVRGVV